jgi:hypothetical protein
LNTPDRQGRLSMGRNRPACEGEATAITTTPHPVPLNFSSLRGREVNSGAGGQLGFQRSFVTPQPTCRGARKASLRSASFLLVPIGLGFRYASPVGGG